MNELLLSFFSLSHTHTLTYAHTHPPKIIALNTHMAKTNKKKTLESSTILTVKIVIIHIHFLLCCVYEGFHFISSSFHVFSRTFNYHRIILFALSISHYKREKTGANPSAWKIFVDEAIGRTRERQLNEWKRENVHHGQFTQGRFMKGSATYTTTKILTQPCVFLTFQ